MTNIKQFDQHTGWNVLHFNSNSDLYPQDWQKDTLALLLQNIPWDYI